jgi:hypothetical protein
MTNVSIANHNSSYVEDMTSNGQYIVEFICCNVDDHDMLCLDLYLIARLQ